MLFKNSFRKILKNKFEFLSFTLFFMIAIFLYVMMNSSLTTMKNSFFHYIDKQNIEDFSFSVSHEEDVKNIALKHHFIYEKETKKWIDEKDAFLEVYPYDEQKKINQLYLIQGSYPKKNEIVISDKFAKENNLHIGDHYQIRNKDYIISGFGYHPSLIYMMVAGKVYADHEHVSNVYMHQDDYQKIDLYEEVMYVAKFVEKKNIDFFLSYLSGEDNPFEEMEKDVSLDQTLLRMMSIYYLYLNIELYDLFSNSLFFILILLSLITYICMLQRKINHEKREIALLKTIGYPKRKIILSYLLYPFLSLIVGSFLGIFLGICLEPIFLHILLKNYQIPIQKTNVSMNILDLCFFLMMLLFIIGIRLYFLLQKDVLILLKGQKVKTSWFLRKIKYMIQRFSFVTKIRFTLFFERFRMNLFTLLLSVMVSFLFLFIFIGNTVVDDMIDSSFQAITYDYEVMYGPLQVKKRPGDMVLRYDVLYEQKDIMIYGIKNENQFILSYSIKNNEIVITSFLAQTLKLQKGDVLTLTIQDELYEFQIVDIEENYSDSKIYISLDELRQMLGAENVYNILYTKDIPKNKLYDEDVLYISSIDEAKESMRNVFSFFESLLFFLSFISVICLIFLFWFLSTSIIEEHRKNIVLLKLFGYSNKNISKIFFSNYHYIIIFSYICAFILIIPFFKMISDALLKENFVFEFHIRLWNTILGFILLWGFYQLSIFFAKRKMKTYEVSELLKREE